MNHLHMLPHQPPMRLIDEVVELVPGERARCLRTTRPGDVFFTVGAGDIDAIGPMVLERLRQRVELPSPNSETGPGGEV